MLSQGTNTLPTSFLGFSLSEKRLDLYICSPKAGLMTPNPRGSWERVFLGRTCQPGECKCQRQMIFGGGNKLYAPLLVCPVEITVRIALLYFPSGLERMKHCTFMEGGCGRDSRSSHLSPTLYSEYNGLCHPLTLPENPRYPGFLQTLNSASHIWFMGGKG